MRYRGPDFYRENGVDVRLGVEADGSGPADAYGYRQRRLYRRV